VRSIDYRRTACVGTMEEVERLWDKKENESRGNWAPAFFLALRILIL